MFLTYQYLVFDDGIHKDDPQKAKEEVEAMKSIMRRSDNFIFPAEEHPLRHGFGSIWQRIRDVR